MRKTIIAILLLLSFASCHEPQVDPIADYVKAVTVSNHESNSLRVNVNIEFKQECDYSVRYWRKDDPDDVSTTKCRHTDGLNGSVTLMYLYEQTEYELEIAIAGTPICSKSVGFKTRSLPSGVTGYIAEKGQAVRFPGYFMQAALRSDGYMTIADMDGKVLWYEPCQPVGRDYITQFEAFDLKLEGNRIWFLNGYLFTPEASGITSMATNIGCVDFEGNVSRLWSSDRGFSPAPLAHHEIIELEDGNILVVGSSQKIYDLTPIGGEPNTLVSGDGYTIFNKEGKIVSQWDCFGEIDPLTCEYVNARAFYWDLVHANALSIDSDGYYYMSFNRINQIWKIDPVNGKVLYRVGENGNVDMDQKGYPSGVHAVTPLAPDRLLCLDNGIESGKSRGLIYKVNPQNMSAEIETMVELPEEYSSYDRSNVSLIDGGKALMFGMTNAKVVVFTDLEGNIVKLLRTSVASYRTIYLDRLPKI